MAGIHTLSETERQVSSLLKNLPIDFDSMAVVSNLFRAANAVKNHLERTVLAPHDLSWTGFVVLWVVWIWQPIETRQIAAEVGTSKASITGVLKTLEGRKLLIRKQSKTDQRLVEVTLTKAGEKLMQTLFPEFNQEEQTITSVLTKSEIKATAASLRKITELTQLD
ncbi:MAG: MarR family winged helix-turn-helix transcriptional regulator [Candidatus Nanopelagicales bacterium]